MILKPLIKPKNKKANIMLIIIFFVALMLILIIGFLMVVGSAVLNWTFDEAVPELSNLGQVGDINMTDTASMILVPLNNVVQSLTWLTGVLYVLMLIGSFGIVFIIKGSPSKWLMGIYFALALMLIIMAMFMSNIYEEFATGTDDLAIRLQEHTILNYMLLYSPAILTVIVFITGALLFSGIGGQDEFV